MASLNHTIHETLGHPSDDVMTLKLNDFELGEEHMEMTLESLMEDNDSNEILVDCEAKKAGVFDKNLILRNATDSALEVLMIYKVKKFTKDRNVE